MKFIGRRRIQDGILLSLTVASALPLGTAVGQDTSDYTRAVVADTTGSNLKFSGFLSQPTKDGGPDLGDLTWPDKFTQPVAVNGQVTLDRFAEIEAEGTDFLVQSGTGALAANTPAGTLLAFVGGKLRIAQPNDKAVFRLTSQVQPEDSGNVRITASLLPSVIAMPAS
jgi:hypothetical protein